MCDCASCGVCGGGRVCSASEWWYEQAIISLGIFDEQLWGVIGSGIVMNPGSQTLAVASDYSDEEAAVRAELIRCTDLIGGPPDLDEMQGFRGALCLDCLSYDFSAARGGGGVRAAELRDRREVLRARLRCGGVRVRALSATDAVCRAWMWRVWIELMYRTTVSEEHSDAGFYDVLITQSVDPLSVLSPEAVIEATFMTRLNTLFDTLDADTGGEGSFARAPWQMRFVPCVVDLGRDVSPGDRARDLNWMREWYRGTCEPNMRVLEGADFFGECISSIKDAVCALGVTGLGRGTLSAAEVKGVCRDGLVGACDAGLLSELQASIVRERLVGKPHALRAVELAFASLQAGEAVCGVCYGDVVAGRHVILVPCGHVFCKMCVSESALLPSLCAVCSRVDFSDDECALARLLLPLPLPVAVCAAALRF